MKMSDALKTGSEKVTVEDRLNIVEGRVLSLEVGIMNLIGSLATTDPEWGYAVREHIDIILEDEEDEVGDVDLEDETPTN